MDNQQKQFFTVLALCLVVFFGGDYLIQKWRGNAQPDPAVLQQEHKSPHASQNAPPQMNPSARTLSYAEAMCGPRVLIETPTLRGSINLRGAQLDDLSLRKYRKTTQASSPEILLLSPQNTEHAYRAWFSWKDRNATPLPTIDTIWKADRTILTPEQPVTLTWENGQGLIFKQTIRIDDHYMFHITNRVHNKTTHPFQCDLLGMIERAVPKDLAGNFILYEGPLGTFNDKFKEISYDSLKDNGPLSLGLSSGWMGITDKYWLVSFAPLEKTSPLFQVRSESGHSLAQISFHQPSQEVAPGGTLQVETRFFAGAKVLNLLDSYETADNIPHFDLAVDFGWFYFLTKPIFYALNWLKDLTGNFGISILLFTVLLKILFFPLANKSYHAMARMKRLQPVIEQLRARYKGDPARLNQEMMAFYKKEKVNPVSGCLPMVLQIPAFFALYKVLFISIEMRHAPFFGWIHDLSAPDPTNIFTLFALIPWVPFSFLHLGIWPILMGFSMLLQQKLNPPPADPVQRTMFLYVMPLMFTFMLGGFPSGLVIYWTWNNILSVLQQWFIMRSDLAKKPIQKHSN